MNHTIFLKKAIIDKGPIRKGSIYKTLKNDFGDEFIYVEDFKKSLVVKMDTEGVLVEIDVPKFDPKKAKEMLLGQKYYPELTATEFFTDQKIELFSFSTDDFITLLESFGKTIKKEQGPVFVTLFDLFLISTFEGVESSRTMVNDLDLNIDGYANKIAAYLIYPFHMLGLIGKNELPVDEIIESFKKSIELSKRGENTQNNWSDALWFYKHAYNALFYEIETSLKDSDLLEKEEIKA